MFGGEAHIPGTLKDGWRAPYWGALRYVKQGSEMGVFSVGAPLLGNMERSLFLRAFLLEEFY